MINPIQSLQNFISRGVSPQKIIEQTAGNNPMIMNLMKMANSGNISDVEVFARNMFKEKGRDFDKEFAEFKKVVGIK